MLHEEEIRNFFLLIINSHFQGTFSGASLNKKGKTDILLRIVTLIYLLVNGNFELENKVSLQLLLINF